MPLRPPRQRVPHVLDLDVLHVLAGFLHRGIEQARVLGIGLAISITVVHQDRDIGLVRVLERIQAFHRGALQFTLQAAVAPLILDQRQTGNAGAGQRADIRTVRTY